MLMGESPVENQTHQQTRQTDNKTIEMGKFLEQYS